MPFTVVEFHDLIKLLEEQPEWRAELRRLMLTEELLALPELVRALAEAQHRTEGRVGRLELVIEQLVEAQRRTEERMGRLELVVEQLVEVQRRTEERMGRLERRMDQMGHDLGELKGDSLERRYRERAFAYFSSLVRRTHVVWGDELTALLEEAVEQGLLLEEEADEVALADVVVRGRRREDGAQVYLLVEVSWGVGISDVERAGRRASLLAKSGTPTVPVVAGQWISEEAADLGREMKVRQLIHGRAVPPDSP